VYALRSFVVAAGLLAVCSPWVAGDDPPKAKEPAAKMRGQLPQNWGKLGLSEEQKQKVYTVQNEYKAKIDALRRQVTELQTQERKDMENVLTDAQKTRLRELAASKAPADTKKEKAAP